MRAKEEVEKLGYKGSEAQGLYDAAVGLHLAEPRALDAGDSAKFLGRVYAAYEKQRVALAAKQGKDPNDPKFQAEYMKGIAAKTAVAAASSPLGPADTIEGMRQFAAQWAAMDIPFEFALAMLAHSSKYGFEAPELGTAFKSMANKVLNPTPTAMRILDARGIDRSKYMGTEAADPQKAVGRLNNLLDGQLFAGKGGKDVRARWAKMLRDAKESGQLETPEFQQKLTNMAMRRLGNGWAGKQDDVRQAVANATLTASGTVDMPAYLKALKEAGLSIGEIAQVFEGRHIARNSPTFQFYEKLIEMYDQLQAVDGSVIDAVTEGRKESEAGKTDAMIGSWQNLMGAIEETGVINFFKESLTGLANALRGLPVGVLQGFSAALLGIGAAALGLTAFGRALHIVKNALRSMGFLGTVAAGGAETGGTGAIGATAAGGAAGLTAANKVAEKKLKQIGAQTAEAKLLKGMGEAGAKAGGKTAAKAGMRFIPGIGWAIAGGMAGYEAYLGYQRDGLKGAVLNPLTLGMAYPDPAGASEAAPNEETLPEIVVGQGSEQIAGVVAEAQSAVDQVRSTFSSASLFEEGVQMMQTLAAGISAGAPAAVAAAQNAAAGIRAAGSRVPLNTGPNMQGAK